mmetsp:Transcript_37132/g.58684  ORF Transcript_37132/g.58684 Transcript_37132/m.58684 type:complete len:200 (+) Transcript_37132:38-637(+)
MASIKEKCLQVALAAARYGDSWWLPLVLLAVCTVNSITGGVLTWSVGILQMALFNIVVLSRKYTWVVGPLMLSTGSLIAGYFYVQMMKSDGADALLAYAGVKDSTWLTKAQSYANDWGVLGLVGMQVVPIPIPSAVIVIAGMMAKMNEVKILVTVYVSKFIQLTLGAFALKYATENQTPEEFIRQQMGAGEQETEEKAD